MNTLLSGPLDNRPDLPRGSLNSSRADFKTKVFHLAFQKFALVKSPIEMATEFLNAVRVRLWFFFNAVGSVRPFPYFFGGWRVRMSVIQTAKIPKIGKIGAKIRASVC